MYQFTVAGTGHTVEVGADHLDRARQWLTTTKAAHDCNALDLPTGVAWPVVQLVSKFAIGAVLCCGVLHQASLAAVGCRSPQSKAL